MCLAVFCCCCIVEVHFGGFFFMLLLQFEDDFGCFAVAAAFLRMSLAAFDVVAAEFWQGVSRSPELQAARQIDLRCKQWAEKKLPTDASSIGAVSDDERKIREREQQRRSSSPPSPAFFFAGGCRSPTALKSQTETEFQKGFGEDFSKGAGFSLLFEVTEVQREEDDRQRNKRKIAEALCSLFRRR
ncbi:hypothetical protein U1Q18_040916 [Sarracenia purpurea var. burkii]